MEYPEGCRQGDKQLFCKGCPDKQRQACGDNDRILKAKKKAHGGISNMEIHAQDNHRIQSKKYRTGLDFPEIPDGEGVINV